MVRQIKVNGDTFVPMISERRLKARIRPLARKINRDYRGKVPVFIGVLNGSFIFFSDLIREITASVTDSPPVQRKPMHTTS